MSRVPCFIFLKDFIYSFLEGKGGRKRGKETSMCGCLLCTLYWDLAHNPGMCPDWESNQWPLASLVGAQSTESHQPGQVSRILKRSLDWGPDTHSEEMTKSLTISTSNESLRLEKKTKAYWNCSYWLMGMWWLPSSRPVGGRSSFHKFSGAELL